MLFQRTELILFLLISSDYSSAETFGKLARVLDWFAVERCSGPAENDRAWCSRHVTPRSPPRHSSAWTWSLPTLWGPTHCRRPQFRPRSNLPSNLPIPLDRRSSKVSWSCVSWRPLKNIQKDLFFVAKCKIITKFSF